MYSVCEPYAMPQRAHVLRCFQHTMEVHISKCSTEYTPEICHSYIGHGVLEGIGRLNVVA